MSININHSKNTIKTDSELTLNATQIKVSDSRISELQDPVDPQDAVTRKFLSDALANITAITDLLVPPQPPTINTFTLNVLGQSSYRITDFTQVDNTNTGLTAFAGTIVDNVVRSNDFTTNILTQVGPGNSGTLDLIRNDVVTSSVTFDSNDNSGTTTDTDSLVISNNIDYGLVTDDATGFFQCYNVTAIGTNTVTNGWNNIKLVHGTEQTNSVPWYSDQTTVPVPTATNITVVPNAVESVILSSSIPHYTSAQVFDISFDVANLSGDFYPTSDTFFDGLSSASGSALGTLNDLTYQAAGISTPLPRNYLVGGQTFKINTSVNVKSGTGIGQNGAGARGKIYNSYNESTLEFAPTVKVLYMQDNQTNVIDETNIVVNNVGYGSGNARRIHTTGGDTPAEATLNNFDSNTLNAWDATVVGGILSHDTTNYSIGYLPVGPDLSSGRTGEQYFEVAFNRTAVSKFNIRWSGKANGCWVRLPGSQIDTTSSMNGWIDATQPYNGAGVPGLNSNGSDGCALGNTFSVGQQVNNEIVTVTFGTETSSNANDAMIVVRFKLNNGDAVTSLQFLAS